MSEEHTDDPTEDGTAEVDAALLEAIDSDMADDQGDTDPEVAAINEAYAAEDAAEWDRKLETLGDEPDEQPGVEQALTDLGSVDQRATAFDEGDPRMIEDLRRDLDLLKNGGGETFPRERNDPFSDDPAPAPQPQRRQGGSDAVFLAVKGQADAFARANPQLFADPEFQRALAVEMGPVQDRLIRTDDDVLAGSTIDAVLQRAATAVRTEQYARDRESRRRDIVSRKRASAAASKTGTRSAPREKPKTIADLSDNELLRLMDRLDERE